MITMMLDLRELWDSTPVSQGRQEVEKGRVLGLEVPLIKWYPKARLWTRLPPLITESVACFKSWSHHV